jgi:Fic family protein
LKDIDVNDVNRHPLSIATYFHQQFLNVIHPFSDGNGRIGRIFTNLILLKNGYPPVFIKEVNKDEYLKRFELSDNDMNPMLEFMADRLIESLEDKWAFVSEYE